MVTTVRRWDGTQWVNATVRRWDGTQWVNATVRRWDGTQWVTVHDPDPDPESTPRHSPHSRSRTT